MFYTSFTLIPFQAAQCMMLAISAIRMLPGCWQSLDLYGVGADFGYPDRILRIASPMGYQRTLRERSGENLMYDFKGVIITEASATSFHQQSI